MPARVCVSSHCPHSAHPRVQILKQEWPHNWPSFVSDIVGSSKVCVHAAAPVFPRAPERPPTSHPCAQTSEILCENNLEILKLLRCVPVAVAACL